MIWLYVACGGAFGAMARFGLHSILAPQPGKFPTATFLANVIGCLVMGVVYTMIVEKPFISPTVKPLIMVGFLGAFTTFSSFSLEALSLWQTQHFLTAVTYVVSSLLGCLLAVYLGVSICEKLIN